MLSKRLLNTFFVTVILVAGHSLFAIDTPVQSSGLSEYPLGSGDLLKIQVFGEQDLSLEIRLSDAGTISYPFLGELMVLNLTTYKLSELIRIGLADGYLINPVVNISILEYRQFYIYGEVKNPGGYPYQPGLTLQKAIALAGGFTERSSKSKIYVVHEKEQASSKLELGSAVRPGDTITIEESFF